ncbi:ABC transporter ATP-binding protein [Ilyobacter sp.]|uniref:ABC transporter ATP-binding protein n=1 Tax=Ilyobacter sp. TaxID=3100343 RepID=UPI00356B2129
MAIVSLKNIKKSYVKGAIEVKALKGITLDIQKGEFTVLAGPSGSGKTTLLNIIGAMDSATSGNVVVDGIDLSLLKPKDASVFRREKIGFIFQDYSLIPVLTVYENVEFSLDLLGNYDKSTKREMVETILKEMDIYELKDRRPSEISGGQQQRVAVARALVKKPSIILADEPTANLDSVTGEAILAMMKKLNEEYNITFIFSSHDLKIIQMAKRVVRLRDGIREGDSP